MASPVRCADCDIPVRPSTGECPMCGRVEGVRAASPEEARRRPRRRRRDEDEVARDALRKLDEAGLGDRPGREPEEGPWLAAAVTAAGVFAASFLATLLLVGRGGFPDKSDMLLLPLLLFFFLGGVAPVAVGISHVRSKYIRGKWGTRTEGSGAVVAGFLEVIVGGLVGGVAGYGLVFRYINWVTT